MAELWSRGAIWDKLSQASALSLNDKHWSIFAIKAEDTVPLSSVQQSAFTQAVPYVTVTVFRLCPINY